MKNNVIRDAGSYPETASFVFQKTQLHPAVFSCGKKATGNMLKKFKKVLKND